MKKLVLAVFLTGCGLDSTLVPPRDKQEDLTPVVDNVSVDMGQDASVEQSDAQFSQDASSDSMAVSDAASDVDSPVVCKFPESSDFMCQEFDLRCKPGFAASVCTAADCMVYCLSVNELRNTPSSHCRDLYQPNCAGSFNVEKWCEFRVAANGTCICSIKLH